MTKQVPYSSPRLAYFLFLLILTGSAILCWIPPSLQAQTIDFYQGFEGTSNDNWGYSVSPAPYNPSNTSSVPVPASVWAPIYELRGVFYAPVGSRMWASSDYCYTAPHYVDFDPIPVAGMVNGVLSFMYITYNLDPWDEIEYSVEYDNGTTWSNYIPLSANNQFWETITVNVPANVPYVRLRLRTRQVTGVVCAGYDHVYLQGSISNPCQINTGAVNTQFCHTGGNLSVAVPFTTSGTFQQGATFIAQLSDQYGSFSNPINIGSTVTNSQYPSGTIQSTIPTGLPVGNGYRIRVIQNNPLIIGSDNGVNITLSDLTFSLSAYTNSSGQNISCPGANDGSIDLTVQQGTAPYTFDWSGPGSFQANSEDLINLGAGTYTVTVTDAVGCSGTQSITLIGPVFEANITHSDISCNGLTDGTISLGINGSNPPYTIQWTGPGTFTSPASTLIGLAAGQYDVVVTDNKGCSLARSVQILDPPALGLAISSPVGNCGHNITCFGANNGIINTVPTGGTPPYSFSWSGPGGYTSSANSPQNLGPGTYSVALTDINGCLVSKSITLSEATRITGTLVTDLTPCGYHISCFGGNDGGLRLDSVAGGCPPYSVQWSNGATGNSAQNLSAGIHSVTITDANGCTMVSSMVLTEPDPIEVNTIAIDPPCETDNTGSIDISPTGGCPPYTYLWVGPGGVTSSAEDLQNLFQGTYSLSLTDGMGCEYTESITLTGTALPTATLGCSADTVICSGDSAVLKVDLTGTPPWSLVWGINGVPTVVTATSSPYLITVQPTTTTTVELLGVGNFCGEGQVCGSATIAVKDCNLSTSNPCLTHCFTTEWISQVPSGNCITYTVKISDQGGCSNGLDAFSLSLPCGSFVSGSTNRGWTVTGTQTQGDGTTGLYGLTITGIQQFGGTGTADNFLLTFTVCDSSGCGLPGSYPLVAYQSGSCIFYESSEVAVQPLAPERTLQLTAYPNPSHGSIEIIVNTQVEGEAWIRIIDLRTAKQIERQAMGYVQEGIVKYRWEGTSPQGAALPAGIYLLEFGVGEMRKTQKLIRF